MRLRRQPLRLTDDGSGNKRVKTDRRAVREVRLTSRLERTIRSDDHAASRMVRTQVPR